MTSPYLDQPLLPLAIALPRMLEEVETELAAAKPLKKLRLQQRAELIRGLLSRQGDHLLRRDAVGDVQHPPPRVAG